MLPPVFDGTLLDMAPEAPSKAFRRAQSSFPEELQGEISGLSRSVSNLGSSLGGAIAGTVLVAGITRTPERSYALAMVVLAVTTVVGLVAAARLPTATATKRSAGGV